MNASILIGMHRPLYEYLSSFQRGTRSKHANEARHRWGGVGPNRQAKSVRVRNETINNLTSIFLEGGNEDPVVVDALLLRLSFRMNKKIIRPPNS